MNLLPVVDEWKKINSDTNLDKCFNLVQLGEHGELLDEGILGSGRKGLNLETKCFHLQ